MKVMKAHGPDGRNCGRIGSDQVANESTNGIAEVVFSFVT